MREIKFRAWNIETREMEDNFEIDSEGVPYEVEDNGACGDPECCGSYQEWIVEHTAWRMMQYTGLRDSKGVEIYEGDIVKNIIRNRFGPFAIEFKELFDNEQGFSLGTGFDTKGNSGNELEVIGNIYENPELLNERVKK